MATQYSKIKKAISITLSGNPLSTQTIYRSSCIGGIPRRYMTKQGKERKEQYRFEAKSQYKGKPLEGDVHANVVIFFKNARRFDIENAIKIALDSLQGALYHDDKQITELIVKKQIDRKNPRVEISIKCIKSEQEK